MPKDESKCTRWNFNWNKVLTGLMTALLLLNLIMGWWGSTFFMDKIYPYVNTMTKLEQRIALAEQWQTNHACVTDDLKAAVKECPKTSEIKPEFKRIDEGIANLKGSQISTNNKIDMLDRKIDDLHNSITQFLIEFRRSAGKSGG